MATSGSDNFVATRDDLIRDSLTMVGALGPNGTIDESQLAHGARALNDLVKSIDADGLFLWRVERLTFTTVASTATYTPPATVIGIDGPMRFTEAAATDATTIERMTRRDYQNIPARASEARAPLSYYVEKNLATDGREQLSVKFWPVPSTSGDSIEYIAFLRGEDFDTGANALDFPQKWIHCLKLGLASVLAIAYHQVGLAVKLQEMFEIEKNKQVNADNEGGDLTFVPFGYGSYT